ncbi:MAG: hypothetical protein K9M07_01680 [Simkaniaceae bacterium]|nr:hypothetical protein [Simkaniaceae bacterium]
MAFIFRNIKQLIIFCLISSVLFTTYPAHALFNKKIKPKQVDAPHSLSDEGYTINFPNVSILELVKFISKIRGVNFIYEDTDLNFNITFTSEEPTSLFNIMSAFTQILSIHGLSVIEDGNNLIIHKNQDVRQIPTIVSSETPLDLDEMPIIVTRVFNIHNANPGNLETIFKPMLSGTALITTSSDTRQMIITDTSSNVEKIAELLMILDTPKTNLDVTVYKSKNANALQLTPLLNELIMPLSEGNPVIIVPQKETNSIFIVSTRYLIEKSLEILQGLDTYSSLQDRSLSSDNILVYKLKYKTASNIENSIKEISKSASEQGFLVSGIVSSIDSAKYIKATNSLLFIGDAESLLRIKSLLETLDVPSQPNQNAENSKFYIYIPTAKSAVEIMSYLKEVEMSLKDSHLSDPNMILTLSSMRLIRDANTIVFTGDSNSIGEIQQLLKTLDLSEFNSKNEYFVYTPIHLSPQTLIDSLHQVADRLDKAGFVDEGFVHAIKEAKYATYSHAIIFTGSADTINKIKSLMNELDHTDKKILSDQNMLIYQVKFADKKSIEKALDRFADSLPIESPIHEAIESSSWMPEAHSLIFRGTGEALARIKEILEVADTAEYAKETIFTYRVANASYDQVKSDLMAYSDQLAEDDPTYQTLKQAKWVPDSRIIIFKGNLNTINKIKEMLNVVDQHSTSGAPEAQKGYILYNLKNTPGNVVIKELKTISQRLEKDPQGNAHLIESIKKTEWIPTTNSLFITGPQGDIDQILKFVDKFDTAQSANSYVIIKLQYASGNDLIKELEEATEKLSKKEVAYENLLQTIHHIEWIKSSNSLFISGPTSDVQKIEAMIKNLDVAPASQLGSHSNFFVYQPKHISAPELQKAIKKLAHDLVESKLSDPILIESLEHFRYNPDTNSFVFTGNDATIARINELLDKIDNERNQSTNTIFFLYKPKNLDNLAFEATIQNIETELKRNDFGDRSLINCLATMRLVKTSGSFLFTGDQITITRLEDLLKTLDVSSGGGKNNQFLMYQAKNMPIDLLAKSLKNVYGDLERSNLANPSLLNTLNSMRIVEKNHTLIFTGTAETLSQISDLLTRLDVPEPAIAANPNVHYFIYKPTKAHTRQVEEAIRNVTKDLEKSGLANTSFLNTLKSMRYVDSTDSLLFTGTQESMDKTEALLEKIDNDLASQTGVQTVGKTTFLVYKIKEANPEYLEKSLDHLARDLKKSPAPDESLITTIEDMRYVKDSNSLIFTGTEETLNKIREILPQFDVSMGPAQPRVSAEGYILYKPKFLKGDELIHLVKDFEQNLINSGVNEPQLFDAINNIKWMPKTGQLLVSGDNEATQKVITLFEKFDVEASQIRGQGESSVETLDDISFLIYKLQFHRGDSIQGALSGIAGDLKRNMKNQSSQGLIEAIDSIQWVRATNSFIANGDPKVLVRLKELLESIDIPLKQVFIEVLVIETDLTGRLEFGLRWGGQGVYKDRMAFSGGSMPLVETSPNFSNLLSQVNATSPPLGTNMPIPSGGSLGVIGDLIFHKGQTYVSLGDFVNAIQSDADSTVVLNQKLITQDNQTSTLFVGENVPYNGSVVTNQSDNTTIAANIEYRDIGIKLSVTPNIGEDNIVSMEIEQSITEEITTGGGSGGTANTVYGIKTRKTAAATKVHVPDKHFVAIAGQIRNTTARTKTAIPCLGGLPIIGAAFSDNTDTKTKANVIMFLRPVIVNTYDEYKKLTQYQENIYRDQAVTEDFDEGMELIQHPDDED